MTPIRYALKGRALVAAGLAATAAASAFPAAAADPQRPLEDARRAAQHASFTARVQLRWHDDTGDHGDDVFVVARDGVMFVRGGTALVARQYERLIRNAQGDWDVLWPSGVGQLPAPAADPKYAISTAAGPDVAGHPTQLVEVRRRGALQERFYVLPDNGMLVGREQFDEAGILRRSVRFESLTIEQPAELPTLAPVRATSMSNATLGGRSAPPSLAAGYRRLGAYRRGGVVHVVYSDGIDGLSVFEQTGRLSGGRLPAQGAKVRLGRTTGTRYTWAGGHVLVWQADDAVYTAVGDGPLADVLAAARSVPFPGAPTLFQRFRRACRALLGGGTR